MKRRGRRYHRFGVGHDRNDWMKSWLVTDWGPDESAPPVQFDMAQWLRNANESFTALDRLAQWVMNLEDHHYSLIYEPDDQMWFVYRHYEKTLGLMASDRISRGSTALEALRSAADVLAG